MTNYTYLQTCDYLNCSSTELAQHLKSGKLTYTVQRERIFITQKNIDEFLSQKTSIIKTIEERIAECITPVIETELKEDLFDEEPAAPEPTTTYPAPSDITYSHPTPSPTFPESTYANPALITAITTLGYNFPMVEKIMTSIGRKRRGKSGALNITHLCKILNTALHCKNKKVRVTLNQLLDAGFLSTKRGQAYSLTQHLSSITHQPLRQLLENYLTSD